MPTDLCCLCFLLLGLRSVTIGAVGGRCQAFPGVGQRFLIRCGRSRIRSGRSQIRCSRSLIRCGRSLITCGMSLITCGMSLITCGRSLIRCGRKLVQTNPYRQLRRNKNIIYICHTTKVKKDLHSTNSGSIFLWHYKKQYIFKQFIPFRSHLYKKKFLYHVLHKFKIVT